MSVNNFQSVLTILLAIELFVITVCVVLVSYFLVKALKSFTQMTESFGKIKSFISIPALLVAIISRIFKKRG